MVARSPNQVDISFLPKGLHDIGCVGMLQRVQAALDAVDERNYDAVIFGYGLCNNGLAGLTARSIPDCAAARARLHHPLSRQQPALSRLLQCQPWRVFQDLRLDRAW